MIENIVAPVVSLGGMGLAFGLLLAYASKKFAVEVDERVEKISEILPSANCGGCGYAGCSAFANAVVEGKAPVNGCPVGGVDSASAIAEIMGVSVDSSVKQVAKVLCNGTCDKTKEKFDYYGATDCVAASKLAGGSKTCSYGCLGLGSCVDACKFDAIVVEDGIAKIIPENCVACGKCIEICPKNIIEFVPGENQETFVLCKSKDKGKDVKSYCEVGCIACKICEKQCKFDAIHVIDNVAVIDYEKCVDCGQCVVKCPVGIIEGKTDNKKAVINEDNCIGCTICKKQCKFDAIEGEVKAKHKVIEENCVGCGLCVEKCPKKCIELK